MSKLKDTIAQTPPPDSTSEDRPTKTHQPDKIEVRVNGVRIEVSPELEEAVHRARKGLLQPLPREMTTNQAAEFLDVSRPFVIKLVERGELPCRLVGKHRRIPSDALVRYRDLMFQQARQAADEMARLAQEAGLYDEYSSKQVQ
jgi:excisionase family DNA binding protein